MSQYNVLPNVNIPLMIGQYISKDWYFYWAGLFRGLPPGNVEPLTVGASPYIYTAPAKGFLIITGGSVSMIEFSRDGNTFYDMGATAGSFPLAASDQLRITHTGAPDVAFVPT